MHVQRTPRLSAREAQLLADKIERRAKGLAEKYRDAAQQLLSPTLQALDGFVPFTGATESLGKRRATLSIGTVNGRAAYRLGLGGKEVRAMALVEAGKSQTVVQSWLSTVAQATEHSGKRATRVLRRR